MGELELDTTVEFINTELAMFFKRLDDLVVVDRDIINDNILDTMSIRKKLDVIRIVFEPLLSNLTEYSEPKEIVDKLDKCIQNHIRIMDNLIRNANNKDTILYSDSTDIRYFLYEIQSEFEKIHLN